MEDLLLETILDLFLDIYDQNNWVISIPLSVSGVFIISEEWSRLITPKARVTIWKGMGMRRAHLPLYLPEDPNLHFGNKKNPSDNCTCFVFQPLST